jgi:hypothetical protein
MVSSTEIPNAMLKTRMVEGLIGMPNHPIKPAVKEQRKKIGQQGNPYHPRRLKEQGHHQCNHTDGQSDGDAKVLDHVGCSLKERYTRSSENQAVIRSGENAVQPGLDFIHQGAHFQCPNVHHLGTDARNGAALIEKLRSHFHRCTCIASRRLSPPESKGQIVFSPFLGAAVGNFWDGHF